MRELNFEEVFQTIYQQVIIDNDWEEDMGYGGMEEEVNSIAKEIFKERFGFDYDDTRIEVSTKKPLTNEQKYTFRELKDEIYNAEDIIDGSYSIGMFPNEFPQIDELHSKLISTLRDYYQLLDSMLSED